MKQMLTIWFFAVFVALFVKPYNNYTVGQCMAVKGDKSMFKVTSVNFNSYDVIYFDSLFKEWHNFGTYIDFDVAHKDMSLTECPKDE